MTILFRWTAQDLQDQLILGQIAPGPNLLDPTPPYLAQVLKISAPDPLPPYLQLERKL